MACCAFTPEPGDSPPPGASIGAPAPAPQVQCLAWNGWPSSLQSPRPTRCPGPAESIDPSPLRQARPHRFSRCSRPRHPVQPVPVKAHPPTPPVCHRLRCVARYQVTAWATPRHEGLGPLAGWPRVPARRVGGPPAGWLRGPWRGCVARVHGTRARTPIQLAPLAQSFHPPRPGGRLRGIERAAHTERRGHHAKHPGPPMLTTGLPHQASDAPLDPPDPPGGAWPSRRTRWTARGRRWGKPGPEGRAGLWVAWMISPGAARADSPSSEGR